MEELKLILHRFDEEQLDAHHEALLSITERTSKTIVKCFLKETLKAEENERITHEDDTLSYDMTF